MKPGSSDQDLERTLAALTSAGAHARIVAGAAPALIEVLDADRAFDRSRLAAEPMVADILDEPGPFRAAGAAPAPQTREIPLGPRYAVGGRRLALIAGPCSVEEEDRLLDTARDVAAGGAVGLRGGAFKPRTSPYAFQGAGGPALAWLARARAETGLAIVTEVMSPEQVAKVAPIADVLQIGSRNMHNTPLLQAVGRQQKPVLLKRGWSATLEEFLQAAEYVLHAGNPNVILCERGIRTHEDYVRNTLALAIVPEIKQRSDLPIIVDPSHGTGRARLVTPMSLAAVAAGADGLLIEVHPDPPKAWSDREQALTPREFAELTQQVEQVARAVGRSL